METYRDGDLVICWVGEGDREEGLRYNSQVFDLSD